MGSSVTALDVDPFLGSGRFGLDLSYSHFILFPYTPRGQAYDPNVFDIAETRYDPGPIALSLVYVVPEPSTLALLLSGLCCLAAGRRR